MTNFASLGLPENILHNLNSINFTTPTPIQAQAIPVALKGQDILGSAQTGTGKTAAFALPMLVHLMNDKQAQALVLLPTRELAQQVLEAANKMQGFKKSIKSALLIGGERYDRQLRQLKENPRIIIGTPGRINDHLRRKSLKLDKASFLVLDETDRMLDMGFGIQLDDIAQFLPDERQTLMFSATMPKNIMSLSKKYLNNPKRITIGELNQATENVKQEIIKTKDATKYDDLKKQLEIRAGSVLIFVKTKFGADRLAAKLSKEKLSADAIHGDLKQNVRERVIANYRQQKNRILVATDIAARGLDIPHIENVINYDLPQCPEDYIHRIGRTGRAGATGLAINFLTPADSNKWKAIYKLLNPTNREKQILGDEYSPISASAISETKKAPKARMSTKNPFKPFAPDRKEKNRVKFNKNAKSFDAEKAINSAFGDDSLKRKPRRDSNSFADKKSFDSKDMYTKSSRSSSDSKSSRSSEGRSFRKSSDFKVAGSSSEGRSFRKSSDSKPKSFAGKARSSNASKPRTMGASKPRNSKGSGFARKSR